MYTCPIELADVRYNAADQLFEATVTLHDNTIIRKYACAIAAPITLPFEDAAEGLARQAVRRHVNRGGLFSTPNAPLQDGQPPRRSLDPRRWLQTLIARPEQLAA